MQFDPLILSSSAAELSAKRMDQWINGVEELALSLPKGPKHIRE
jgi:hypothetical protein